ncbi:ATP-binding protein [Amycolatopsis minnesotensis]|uniref:ATP-binding protein n=1 Tax=Amycolatopsis minnesotensis TaxID=337894 RepID=A0ABN2Q485_9PSEU
MARQGTQTARPDGDKLSVTLEPGPAGAATSRRAVRTRLAELGVAGEQADDILLVTSELVTNAIEHGSGAVRLELGHDDRGLELRVYDNNSRPPVLRVGDSLAARSRGLRLVETLSTAWGSEPLPGGKCVWARFAR